MKGKKWFSLSVAVLFSTMGVFADSNEKGIDLYRAGLYDAAKIFFTQQTNQSLTEQAENYYYLGQIYFQLQQTDSAAYFYDKAVTINPDYPFGYIGQGTIALTKGNAKEAESLFKTATGFAKKDPSVQTTIAETYIDANIYPQAEEALTKAEKIDKKYSGIFLARGNMALKEKKQDQAYGWYEQAIYFNPNDKLPYLKLAQAYEGSNSQVALEYLDKLINIDPNYIPAYALIGDINRAEGKYLQALDAYKKFIAIPGVPVIQHERYAQLLYFTDKFAESLEQINYVLKQDPNNAVMHRLKGYNSFKLGENDLAIAELTSFLQNNSEEDHIYLDYIILGRAQIKAKQADAAINSLLKAAKKDVSKSEVFKELANAYEFAGNYPEAIKMYEKFFEIEPTPVVFDFFYYGQANYSAASKYIDPEILNAAKTPEQKAANDADLQSYIAKGNGAFEEVISRSPESYLGYLWKARLNSFLDVVEQARTDKMNGSAKPYFEKALEVMSAKNEEGARNKEIIEAYNYLISYYYIVVEDKAKVGEYSKKILEIDPDNAKAKQTLDALKIKY